MSDEEEKKDAAGQEPVAEKVGSGPVKPERAEGAQDAKHATHVQKAQANEEYRRARAALKAARKRAGKSNAPKVVGGIALALVLVAAGAAGGWFLSNRQSSGEISSLQSQLSSTQQELDQANDEVTATQTILDGGSRAYVGSWSGDLISTLGAATKRCYGASDKPLSLTIESISATGQMTLKVEALYHGHETATLANDVTRSDGDAMVKSGEITSTFSSKSFTFRAETGTSGNYAVVTVSPTTSADAHIQLGVVVESYYKDGLVETDQYLLKKAGDDSSASESAAVPETGAEASSSESSAE